MAGLVRNSGRSRAMPLFPLPDTSIGFWESMGQGTAGNFYLPGFAGGTAGRCIKINYGNAVSHSLYQRVASGGVITDGVWNGGMTIAEAAGSSNADTWVNWYMDESENKLYCITKDTSTSPHTLYTSSVNEAGTVTAIGNAQLGNASFNGIEFNASYGNGLYRSGGDGSGTLNLTSVNTSGGNAAAAEPYRGVTVQVNASNGSITYSNFLGTVFSNETIPYGYSLYGPTSNGMVMLGYSHMSSSDYQAGEYVQLINTTNGKHVIYAVVGGDLGFPWGNGIQYAQRWRGRYFFVNQGTQYGRSASPYLEADVHTWLDEIGVFYGLL